MIAPEGLVQELYDLNVSNVYIYVGDAVRWDYLSSEVSQLGSAIRTLAASTTSPPSFSSLLTGLQPTSHGVHEFDHQLNSKTFRMLDIEEFETEFLNSHFGVGQFEFGQRDHEGIDPIYSVLGINEPDDIRPLNQIETPFLYMERGPGGHLPYGEYQSTSEYFERGLNVEILQEDYKRSIERDVELFKTRLNTLKERDLLDDTLVIYTSDHGELLGEGGVVGHNAPMCPSLVYVPTVFIHESIPKSTFESFPFNQVSILPTILSVVDAGVDGVQFDGKSLLKGVPKHPSFSIYNKKILSRPEITLRYEGVWDSNGGYVFPNTNLIHRLIVLSGKVVKSPKRRYLRRNLLPAAISYAQGQQKFGNPSFSRQTAQDILFEANEKSIQDSKVNELSESQQNQLQNLGYLR